MGPLFHLRLEGSAPSLAHEAARAELGKLMARGGRYAIVVDLREASLPGLEEQRGLFELFVRHRARMARSCAGIAVVARGRATKAAIRALVWFAPPPVPLETFPHAMAAEAWLHERLARAPA
jgi:hypothetical protein